MAIIRSEAHRTKHMLVRHSEGYKAQAILPPNRKCDKCDFIISSEEQNKKHMKVRHKEVDKALWVAESVLSNVDFDCLSKKMEMKVKCVKAYTAIFDEQAVYPNEIFLEVLDKELANDVFIKGAHKSSKIDLKIDFFHENSLGNNI